MGKAQTVGFFPPCCFRVAPPFVCSDTPALSFYWLLLSVVQVLEHLARLYKSKHSSHDWLTRDYLAVSMTIATSEKEREREREREREGEQNMAALAAHVHIREYTPRTHFL